MKWLTKIVEWVRRWRCRRMCPATYSWWISERKIEADPVETGKRLEKMWNECAADTVVSIHITKE